MNGRNVDQIIRQRRQHRVGRLAVAAMFHQEEARRGNQERRGRGQLVAAQGTGEYRAASVRRKPVARRVCIVPVLRFNRPSFLQMKTVSVALVLCLNVGVDPPDIIKIQPCARLECWIGITLLCGCSMVMNYKYIIFFFFCVTLV